MPTLSYSRKNIEQYDFENKILDGRKIHTIRSYRKKPFKIDDTLYHYKNWRTKQVQKICENKCLYVADIIIDADKNLFKKIGLYAFHIYINKNHLKFIKYTTLAINDGFDDIIDFAIFFLKSGLPFYGQIIGWIEGIDYE